MSSDKRNNNNLTNNKMNTLTQNLDTLVMLRSMLDDFYSVNIYSSSIIIQGSYSQALFDKLTFMGFDFNEDKEGDWFEASKTFKGTKIEIVLTGVSKVN